jgi:outer membrane immunogenic protein
LGGRDIKPSGGFGGGQIGYNWQGIWSPRLVLGIEADIQWAGIDDAIASATASNLVQSKMDWFGTVRGRLGYGMDGTLLYVTGGFAYGGLDKTEFSQGLPGLAGFDFRFNGTATGYVIGGGIEHRISPAWSLKGEYQYLNFGKNDLTDPHFGSITGSFDRGKLHDDDFHTVRVSLNYHFGQDYAGGGGLKDAPYGPANSWTGFYAGVNGGIASGGASDVFDFANGIREI